MSNIYTIYGGEMSPYSVKVRSYFRYKQVPHQWVVRSMENEEEYKKVARIPIIPAVKTPEGEGWQDSTPIMEKLDALAPAPSTHPDDPALAFLSVLIEEWGDEWGNKIMFHHRWWDEADKQASARVIALGMAPSVDLEATANIQKMIADRMGGRGDFVGSSAATAPLIEQYLHDLLALLDAHLEGRKYLFGDRPSFGDFGLYAQVYEMIVDPTAGGIIRGRTKNILDWCFRMTDPRNDGDFESWESLQPTLEPIIENIGAYFLPWSVANAAAFAAGEESFTVSLNGKGYTQPPQKYHMKSLEVLRGKYEAVADKSALDPILDRTGCLSALKG
ncbi:MAG: glutathione S-transferase N-terminal domain-containing protein [Alphaproteobacteria bacterium]